MEANASADVQRCTVVPVRHHSPACAKLVQSLIRAFRPSVVLIEGPSDASDLIPLLLDSETRPPVALMAYLRPGSSSVTPDRAPSLFYPFCDYSPEWVAMREGAAVGAEIRFCDLPAGVMLTHEDEEEPDRSEFSAGIAAAYGFSSHEEWWEALFEGQPHTEPDMMRLLLAYGDEIADHRDPFTDLREQWMWHAVVSALDSGAPPSRIMLVCGAAHAVHFPLELSSRPALPRTPPVEFAVTPYTFAYLSRQSGYGAGNTTPLLWQRAWALGGLQEASAACLVDAAAHLREAGWDASTADTIAAYATARQLSGLRGKSVPGAAEIRLAATTVWSRQPDALDGALDSALVGFTAGSVGSAAGETPLMADFRKQAHRFWRVMDAVDREERLRSTIPLELEKSRFLHRARICGIDFGRLRDAHARADPAASLWTRYEVWIRRWTPQTEMSLAHLSPLGSSVREVAERILQAQIADAPSLPTALSALLDAAVAGLEEVLLPAITAVEGSSVVDVAWEAMAQAAARLARLQIDAGLPAAVLTAAAGLAGRLFARACVHLAAAARCTAERATIIGQGLLELQETVLACPHLGSETWWKVIEHLAQDPTAHPYLNGLAASLLGSQQRMGPAEMARLLRIKLSQAQDADTGSSFIEGLLALNRAVLLRSPSLAAAMQDYVMGLGDDSFRQALPLLRRTFQGLSRPELLSFVTALRPNGPGVGGDEAPARLPSEIVADARSQVERLLEHAGQHDAGARLSESAAALAAMPGPAAARAAGFLHELQSESTGTGGGARLLAAWNAIDTLRLELLETEIEARSSASSGRAAISTVIPGLSIVPGSGTRSPVIRANGDRMMEEITSLLTDSRRETRPDRVATVAFAAALEAERDPASIVPLLAHGDYTRLLTRAFADRRDSMAIARLCIESDNGLMRRAGLRIAARKMASRAAAEDGGSSVTPEDDPGDLLFAALADDDLWPLAYRLLRKMPAGLLRWLQSYQPEPGAVPAESVLERQLARAARALSGFRDAVPWLRECLAGPDRIALEAAVSLVMLGELSPEELKWTASVRGGDAAVTALRRYKLERQAAIEAEIIDLELDADLAGSLDERIIRRLCEAAERPGQETNRLAALAEVLGCTRLPAAAAPLQVLLRVGHPLVGASAATALGRIDTESVTMALITRNASRGSDVDRLVLEALSRTGDLRSLDYLAARVRKSRAEDLMPAEILAIAGIGGPLRLVLPSWLDDGSPVLRAVAETLILERSPAALEQWTSRQSPAERVEALCLRILLPLADPEQILPELAAAAAGAGRAAVSPLVRALKAATGAVEAALVSVLASLRSVDVVGPLLRISKTARWKLDVIVALGDTAVPVLAASLHDTEIHVVRTAQEALRAIGSPAAAAALDSAASQPRARRNRRSS